MLWTGWSPVPPISLPSLWRLFHVCQLQLVSITFMFHTLFSPLARSKYLSLFLLSLIFILWSAGRAKSTSWHVPFFLVNTRSGFLAQIRGSICISKSQRILGISFSRTILICVCTICQNIQISISCIIPSGSPFLSSHTYSCISFVPICCIRFIIYTCYSVVYYNYYEFLSLFLFFFQSRIYSSISWQIFKIFAFSSLNKKKKKKHKQTFF